MSWWQLALRGTRHHWRAHLGVLLGAALGATVLVGALLVGDSVRASLLSQALSRIGGVDAALSSNDRFFRAELAEELEAELASARFSPVLQVQAVVSARGGARRAGNVALHGIDGRFLALGPRPPQSGVLAGPGEVRLSPSLARQLEAELGDTLLLRVERPSALPRDMILATTEDSSLALRVTFVGVQTAEEFGRFGLQANQVPPRSAFVALGWLQAQLALEGRANLLLVGGSAEEPVLAQAANEALRATWSLADAQLDVHTLADDVGTVELTTERVFLDESVVAAAAALGHRTTGVLTYFVNALRAGERSTPYSMVTAIGALGADRPALDPIPANLAGDELIANAWLAEDLGVGPGDRVELAYWVPGPDRRLREETRAFTVRAVVPMEGLAGDPTLMPAFPGLEDSENCRDWETGVPVDLETIRDADEAYWDDHHGTPKAFVALEAGLAMWSNRFGTLTAVRASGVDEAVFRRELQEALDPAGSGLSFVDVRGPALAASASPTDFGGLFIGLSFFLIFSAVMLTALLFVFGIEQRGSEIGLLLALGYRHKDVRRLFFYEAGALALAGSLIGGAAGVFYTRAVLHGLATVWQGAVGATTIAYHASPSTLAFGVIGAWLFALIAIGWSLRRVVRRSALELLSTSDGFLPSAVAAAPRTARKSLGFGALLAATAVALGLWKGTGEGMAAAGAFFGAGAALLGAGIFGSRWLIARLGREQRPYPRSVVELGLRNGTRRPGRSLATVTLLACGTFLVVSIGVHHKSASVDAASRSAGTGGFALYGRSTLGVFHDLETATGAEEYGIDPARLEGLRVVPMRVHAGDDASCLNLNAPQTPQLVGVDPMGLSSRGAFAFAKTLGGEELASPWLLLDDEQADGTVPAIADQASVTWVMKKALGDTLEYMDERGRPFQVRIVATLADSILQGSLLISEAAFQARYPSESGYRMFLMDVPPQRLDAVTATLSRALSDVGLELVSAADRLAEFHAVQNTYLQIFQVLGGLGVLLGSVGLGVVVLRNALERRRELAVVRAIGYTRRALRMLLLSEHGLLLVLGLLSGTGAALLALLPILSAGMSGSSGASLGPALPLLAAIAVNGLVWVWIASALAVRGSLVGALRNE